MLVLNESLKSLIKAYRNEKYSTLDLITAELVEQLHKVEGVTYFEDRRKDQIVFALPLSTPNTAIIYPKEGYSMSEMLKLSRELGSESLKKSFDFILRV